MVANPLSASPTKWSNTLKQFVGNLPTNCLSVFDHFVKLALKWLIAATSVFFFYFWIFVCITSISTDMMFILIVSSKSSDSSQKRETIFHFLSLKPDELQVATCSTFG